MTPLRALAAATLAALSLSAHAVGRMADVTVFDRATGRELPVHWHDGRAYVVGRPGNEYQVMVRSQRGGDLLAVVSVDGVNVLSGETASTRQGGYIVSPWGRIDIRGWRKSLAETAAFYFTSLGDSYAARTDRPQNVGVIGVALFERKRLEPRFEEIAPPPAPLSKLESNRESDAKRDKSADRLQSPAESQAGAMAQRPSAPLGTGHGRREESRVQWTQFERATEEPAETVAIYYDSYRNLAARGILQSPAAQYSPNPFPTAFAPDPWR